MNTSYRILLAGAGRMGGALLAAWGRDLSGAELCVVEPAGSSIRIQSSGAVRLMMHQSLSTLPVEWTPDVVVFAVKPQSLDAVLPEYAVRFRDAPLYLSIAAGKTLAFYQRALGKDARIVRAMPNTPAAIGAGITVLCASAGVTPQDTALAHALFETVGEVEEVADETLMHTVTALSGSGPAYAFAFIEALAEAGAAAGLPADMARRLAEQTVQGAAAYAASGGKPLAELRAEVASPGGTTEAGLAALYKDGAFIKQVGEALRAAARRSEELANSSGA